MGFEAHPGLKLIAVAKGSSCPLLFAMSTEDQFQEAPALTV